MRLRRTKALDALGKPIEPAVMYEAVGDFATAALATVVKAGTRRRGNDAAVAAYPAMWAPLGVLDEGGLRQLRADRISAAVRAGHARARTTEKVRVV
jgi:hypothetical protein